MIYLNNTVYSVMIYFDKYNDIEYGYIWNEFEKHVCINRSIDELKKIRFVTLYNELSDIKLIPFDDWVVKINNLETFV